MHAVLVDPGPSELIALTRLGLNVRLRVEGLPRSVPHLAETGSVRVGMSPEDLRRHDEETLWGIHDGALLGDGPALVHEGGVSLLLLKRELAARALRSCVLCEWRCAVDRARGARGRCGLTAAAAPASPVVHVGEEALISPSLLIPLRGCGLRCESCQQWSLLDPGPGAPLDFFGSDLPLEHVALARTVSFIGGNPDESLPGILDALAGRPGELTMPIVWNTHGWVPSRTIALLHGLADVYVTDLKYGNDECAMALSHVPRYTQTLLRSIALQARQGVPVIVRLLVLPGHLRCCALPALRQLSGLGLEGVQVSLASRYVPHWRCVDVPGPLGRPVSEAEVEAVRQMAEQLGLSLAAPGLEIAEVSDGERGSLIGSKRRDVAHSKEAP